uniref:Uncharacterized protein n=1 Tax=Trichogramma kaykai TaxID=54128 RepID=A0ABD2WH24_9HYME
MTNIDQTNFYEKIDEGLYQLEYDQEVIDIYRTGAKCIENGKQDKYGQENTEKLNELIEKNVHFEKDIVEDPNPKESEENWYSEMKEISERKEAILFETNEGIQKLRIQMSELIKLQIIIGKSLQDLLKVQCETQRKFDTLSKTLTTLLLEDRQRQEEQDLSKIPRNKIPLKSQQHPAWEGVSTSSRVASRVCEE